MSRPRWQVRSAWCWNWGLRRGTTSSGSSAMRERRQIEGASVGNRAAMSGGSMSRPRWLVRSAWCWNWGLRRGTTSSGSSAMRERPQVNAQA
jgi:hypothetical protein